MPGRVRRGALMLALLVTATVGGAGRGFGADAGNVDCWLLEGGDLDQARDQGLCQDAFSRNSRSGEPPVVTAPAAPIPGRKPTPPAKTVRAETRAAKTRTTAQASQVVRPARPAPQGGADFGTQFRRDWNSLMHALAGGGPFSGGSQPASANASVPPHMSRNGR